MSAALRLAGTAIAVVAVAGLFSVGMLSLGQVSAPSWVKRLAEDRIAAITGGRIAELGEIRLSFDLASFSPLMTVDQVGMTDLAGLSSLEMSRIQIALDIWEALTGTLQVRTVTVDSTRVSAEIDVSSARSLLAAGAGELPLSDLLSRLGAFRVKAVSALEELEFASVEAHLRVPETGRTLRLTGGRIEVFHGAAGLEAFGRFAWELSETEDASVTVSLAAPHGGRWDIEIEINGARPVDLETFASLPNRVTETVLPLQTRLSMRTDHEGMLDAMEWEIAAPPVHNAAKDMDGRFQLHGFSASGDYRLASSRITIRDLRFESSAGAAAGAGYLDLYSDPDGVLFAAGRMEFRDGRTGAWKWLPSGIQGITGAADFRIDLRTFDFEIAQLSVRAEETILQAQGQAHPAEGGWEVAAEFGFTELNRDALIALWPGRAHGAKKWFADRLHAGQAFSGSGGLRTASGENTALYGNFQFNDLGLEFINAFPPLVNSAGFAVFDGDSLAVRFESGAVSPEQGSPVDIAGTEIKLAGLSGENPAAIVNVSLTGPADSVLYLLDHAPLKLLASARLSPDLAQGNVTASGRFQFPLQGGLTADDISFTVSAEARDVSSREVEGHSFESELVRINADNESILVEAEGRFRGIPVSGAWSRVLTPEARSSPITGTVKLSSEAFEKFGIPLPPGAVRGEQGADFFLSFFPGRQPEFGISADAANLAFSIPGLSAEKAIGEPAQLVLEGRLGEPAELRRISLMGESYELEGSVKFNPKGSISTAVFSNIRFGDWLDVSAAYEAEGEYAAMITGGTADLNKAPVSQLANRGIDTLEKPVHVELDEVRLSSGIVLNSVTGTVFVDKDIRGELIAKLNGQADVRVSVNLGNDSSSMYFRSDDAGALLRAAGVVENLYGGEIVVAARPEKSGPQINLRLKIVNVRARQMPTLGEVLSMASIIGLAEQLNGDGILFSEVQADILSDEDRVEFRRAFASGPSLGMTVEGVIDRKEGNMDIKGVITPLNVANEILILTPLRALGLSKGDGIGAVSYFIRGPAENPTAGVNPLSVFTPGIFKNLFQ